MKCYVYRSQHHRDTYLYLPKCDDFSDLPENLHKLFGKPVLALEFDLTPGRSLARADARQIIEAIREKGYFLQIPPLNHALI